MTDEPDISPALREALTDPETRERARRWLAAGGQPTAGAWLLSVIERIEEIEAEVELFKEVEE